MCYYSYCYYCYYYTTLLNRTKSANPTPIHVQAVVHLMVAVEIGFSGATAIQPSWNFAPARKFATIKVCAKNAATTLSDLMRPCGCVLEHKSANSLFNSSGDSMQLWAYRAAYAWRRMPQLWRHWRQEEHAIVICARGVWYCYRQYICGMAFMRRVILPLCGAPWIEDDSRIVVFVERTGLDTDE